MGFVQHIAQVGCCCLGLWSTYGEPSESVISGVVGSSRPPIMRPGIAPGRAAAAGVASCTRRTIRVSRQWRGWQLAPANYATRDSTQAAGVASCTRRAIRVSRQWRGWQLAPANYATRDSTRAGGIRGGRRLHLSEPCRSRISRRVGLTVLAGSAVLAAMI